MAAAMGRPAVCTMSATRKSSQPELSPRGAEIKRKDVPLKSRPAGAPVPRSSRSMRPWAEASVPPLVRTTVSKVSVGAVVETSSCQGDSPLPLFAGVALPLGACWFAGWPAAALRTANCGRSVSPVSGRCTSNSGGSGASGVPA